MSRSPDTFFALLRQVADERGGGPDVVRSRLAAVRRDRRRLARLERLYGYALRHPASGRDRVLHAVAGQVLEHGAAFVLGRGSREAQLALSWGRQLVAEWHFQFPVVDLVLRHFRRRWRGHTLMIRDGRRIYVQDGCGISLKLASGRGAEEPSIWSSPSGGDILSSQAHFVAAPGRQGMA